MTKSRIIILAIAVAVTLTFIAGCSTTENANADTERPDSSNETVSTEEKREIVFSDENITISVPEKYAALLYTDSLYSDDFFTVIANVYYKPEYHEPDAYTAQTCGGWMLTVQSTRESVMGMVSGAPTTYRYFIGDGDVTYLEERPLVEYYHCTQDNFNEYSAILEAIVVDFGNMQQVYAENDDVLLPPPYSDKSMDTATKFADYFVNMLNIEQDLTGNDCAMDSWRDLFDFVQNPIYRSGLSEVEYSENVYQFVVSGTKDEIVNTATVLINLQGDEPIYSCTYTRYYPYVLQTATKYVELLADGDVKQLAIWLSVDGGLAPSDDFIRQAERGLSSYDAFSLHDVTITGIRFDNEAQRFYCSFNDAQGVAFDIVLRFGDGLIMPVSP